MDNLSLLFDGMARVKIMRLFLFNETQIFDLEMIASRTKTDSETTKREIAVLEKAGLVKRKTFFKTIEVKHGGKKVEEKEKANGFILNKDYVYLIPLRGLLIDSRLLRRDEILKRLGRAGKLRLVIAAGVFTKDLTSRVDLFIVGDHLRKNIIDSALRAIEAEIGRELSYAVFETEDFKYRLGVCDKLVRDVLDYPHEKILDRLDISTTS